MKNLYFFGRDSRRTPYIYIYIYMRKQRAGKGQAMPRRRTCTGKVGIILNYPVLPSRLPFCLRQALDSAGKPPAILAFDASRRLGLPNPPLWSAVAQTRKIQGIGLRPSASGQAQRREAFASVEALPYGAQARRHTESFAQRLLGAHFALSMRLRGASLCRKCQQYDILQAILTKK